jgi:fructose-1,6-bisphosphatase/sedoheptulose 1,7-bisphosphatase-like protein
MSQDISIFGIECNLTATTTFANGLNLTAFANDGDPLNSPDIQLADMAVGPNGDTITWSRPELIEIESNFIPGSNDDINLTVLADANRVAKGKSSARDQITMVWTYPNGMVVTASDGKFISYSMAQSGTSEGKMKSKRMVCRFGQVTRTNAPGTNA